MFLLFLQTWIAANWPTVVSSVVGLVTAIGVLAKILSAVSMHEKQIERLSLIIEAHASSMTLHRTPDFERRLDELNTLLREIKHDVAALLHHKNKE